MLVVIVVYCVLLSNVYYWCWCLQKSLVYTMAGRLSILICYVSFFCLHLLLVISSGSNRLWGGVLAVYFFLCLLTYGFSFNHHIQGVEWGTLSFHAWISLFWSHRGRCVMWIRCQLCKRSLLTFMAFTLFSWAPPNFVLGLLVQQII